MENERPPNVKAIETLVVQGIVKYPFPTLGAALEPGMAAWIVSASA